MHRLQTYLPQDRLRALADSRSLPNRTYRCAILADISGFTRLTEKLTQSLGARKGVDTLSRQLHVIFSRKGWVRRLFRPPGRTGRRWMLSKLYGLLKLPTSAAGTPPRAEPAGMPPRAELR